MLDHWAQGTMVWPGGSDGFCLVLGTSIYMATWQSTHDFSLLQRAQMELGKLRALSEASLLASGTALLP